MDSEIFSLGKRERKKEKMGKKIPRRNKTKKLCYYDSFMISCTLELEVCSIGASAQLPGLYVMCMCAHGKMQKSERSKFIAITLKHLFLLFLFYFESIDRSTFEYSFLALFEFS